MKSAFFVFTVCSAIWAVSTAAETASWAVSDSRLPASLRTFFVAWAISLAATLNSSLLEEREM